MPFAIAVQWFQYWVTQNPNLNWQTLTFKEFTKLALEGDAKFPQLTTANTNLTAFQKAGGKLVLWQGLADFAIFPQQLMRYYNGVVKTMDGLSKTQSFARLFFAPGNGHCGAQSLGPVPVNSFGAVVNWVETGTAPATILATTVNASGQVVESRPLCAYPLGARYIGSGSLTEARNFYCAPTFQIHNTQ